MMRVLVIADTHIPVAAKNLPDIIIEEAKKSDCCLHAGDFIDYQVFEQLSGLTKVYAVFGNMDSEEVIKKLPRKTIIDLEELKVGLIHGQGAPSALIASVDLAFDKEKNDIDLFVFGHSHNFFDQEIEGKIYFNPGSCTDKMFASQRSYGILDINAKTAKRRIIKIE